MAPSGEPRAHADPQDRADLARPDVWAGLRRGERLGPLTWTLDPLIRGRRLAAIGAEDGAYGTRRPGADVLLPAFFQDAYYALMDLRYSWPLAVAAKTEIESCLPAPAAGAFLCDVEIVDTYERRGGRYVVTLTRARDAEGRLVCVLRNTALTNPAEVLNR